MHQFSIGTLVGIFIGRQMTLRSRSALLPGEWKSKDKASNAKALARRRNKSKN